MVSIKNVASETYFYDEEKEPTQTVEKAFSVLEGSFKRIYESIVCIESLDSLSVGERETLSLFVSTQELRTKEHRETIGDMIRQSKAKLSKENLSENLRLEIEKWGSEEQIKSVHLSGFKDAGLYAEYILNMKWILIINRTKMPFWTSDNPINRFNPLDLKPYGNLGLLSKGIEIHYPLTPNLVLTFSDPTLYRFLPNIWEVTDIQNVVFENWLQVSKSTRHIFSNLNDFSLAERILREHPELKVVDRTRIRVS